MKKIILLIIFSQLCCLYLDGQPKTKSYLSEYDVSIWAENMHSKLNKKATNFLYNGTWDLYDSLGNKLNKMERQHILYDEIQIQYTTNQTQKELTFDSTSGKFYLQISQADQSEQDIFNDSILLEERFHFNNNYFFTSNFVAISNQNNYNNQNGIPYIKNKDFIKILDKELELYIRYFKINSTLSFDSICLQSNSIMRNLNLKIATLTFKDNVNIYEDENLNTKINNKELQTRLLSWKQIPKDTLSNKNIIHKKTTLPISENLPTEFSQIYFVVDEKLKVSALSSFYFLAYHQVIVGKSHLGFIRKRDVYNEYKEDKYFISTLIDYAIRLKLTELYDTQLKHLKNRSAHLQKT